MSEPSASSSDEAALSNRLQASPATLWITISTQPLEKTEVGKNLTRLAAMNASCAVVILDVKPGTGANFVHQPYSVGETERQVCSATARLLSIQHILELALVFFGIRMKPSLLPDSPDKALWPYGNFRGAQIIRRRRPAQSTPIEPLEPWHMVMSLWDFVEPLSNLDVVIHIQMEQNPDLYLTENLALILSDLKTAWISYRTKNRGDQEKLEVASNSFEEQIPSAVCVITGSVSPVECCHIIPRTLPPEVVNAAFLSLFDSQNYNIRPHNAEPLFGTKSISFSSWASMDNGSFNGIRLTPTLHSLLDHEGRLSIISGHLYVFGTPGCDDESGFFEPACPSRGKARRTQTGMQQGNRNTLWVEQEQHEKLVRTYRCNVKPEQEATLNVNALLRFSRYHMCNQPVTIALFNRLRQKAQMEMRPHLVVPSTAVGSRIVPPQDSGSNHSEDWDEEEEQIEQDQYDRFCHDTTALAVVYAALSTAPHCVMER
ncbi:hypothetical protein A4X13_0g6520 [Tilletia indica]|uniref:HNH nuclease domain-containing protein n=1 Tax=Tilletia indica TaxID=43049 RepID=A0A177T8W0_9BASI|nr:hypothetical protein A4X13_0g6520 [Tilletia indica]